MAGGDDLDTSHEEEEEVLDKQPAQDAKGNGANLPRPTATFSMAQALSMVRCRQEDQQRVKEEEEKKLEEQRKEKAREKRRRRRQNQRQRKAKLKAEVDVANQQGTESTDKDNFGINDEESSPRSSGLKRAASDDDEDDDSADEIKLPAKKRSKPHAGTSTDQTNEAKGANQTANRLNKLIPRPLLIKKRVQER